MPGDKNDKWWHRGVLYEVYVRSFADSNGDGVGDLSGVRSKLDYLQWLGADAIWLTPIYPSPMADFGYDIADYCDIDPVYGTFANFDSLLDDVHRRGMKLLLDFVPNHTSDRHPWFAESRSSRDNPKRDWYVWRDPGPDGGPPSNWISTFGGSTWQFDEATGQYYYHAFLKEQPDLNWRNPEVREAMHGVMRFWLDRGIDGFRADAIGHLLEDEHLRDNPPNPKFSEGMMPADRQSPVFSRNRPATRDLFRELGRVVAESGNRLLIGEVHVPTAQIDTFYGNGATESDMPFNFTLLRTPWRSPELRSAIDTYVGRLHDDDWPNWVLGNHDASRVASRIGRPQARNAAVLLLTLRGTPVLYYGDELGMCDVAIPPDRARDPQGRLVPGHGRDPERTPMQWDASPAAGFTKGTPWLPLADDSERINVERQRDDPTSILTLYRRLIALRRQEPAFHRGDYAPVDSPDGTVAFTRSADGNTFLVALNVEPTPKAWYLPTHLRNRRLLLSTHLDREEPLTDRLDLRPDEAAVISLDRR